MSRIAKVSDRILERLTSYYHFLRKIDTKKTKCITSNKIAESLNISPILIRKDLFATRVKGKPKKGYSIHKLLIEIEKLLGWGDPT
ncbi:MAG: winged-helix domain-containing protein, partial [Candidatus Cloacimonadota bacterium]|nr:winged-helix domain-containing protein [Candidatus Cloacimonadota bacterium]